MNVDYDGDGIAERRRICAIGSDGATSCTTSRGTTCRSRLLADPDAAPSDRPLDLRSDRRLAGDQTTLMRQYLDSVYSSTLPRMIAVEGQVNLDDLLDGSAGGVIRAVSRAWCSRSPARLSAARSGR